MLQLRVHIVVVREIRAKIGQNSKECEEVCEEAPQVYHRKEAQAQAHETSIQEEEFIIFRYAYIHMYVDIYTCLI